MFAPKMTKKWEKIPETGPKKSRKNWQKFRGPKPGENLGGSRVQKSVQNRGVRSQNRGGPPRGPKNDQIWGPKSRIRKLVWGPKMAKKGSRGPKIRKIGEISL